MIINDTYKIAFIHIPKCAGSVIRKTLQPFDETLGAFTDRIDNHPSLGRIDYVHIPLFVLRQHFPNEYQKICNYATYATLRDPRKRFPSSLAQHLKMYGEAPIQDLKAPEIKKEIEKVIYFLSNQPKNENLLPPQYIHFQSQVDFVYDGDRKIINNLFSIENVFFMLSDISKKIEMTDSEKIAANAIPKLNKSVVYRNNLYRVAAKSIKPILKRILSYKQQKIARSITDNFLYITSSKKLNSIFSSDYIYQFVDEYYKEDQHLYYSLASTENTKN